MTARTLPWDWHPGTIPDNVRLADGAYLETTYSFHRFRSRRRDALILGAHSAAYMGCMFDLGPRATFHVGRYSLLNGLWLICDHSVTIGDYCLIAWNVVIMDNYRASRAAQRRRRMLRHFALQRDPDILQAVRPRPVHLGRNVWVGFDSCILPGVHIGDGAVIGARSVVDQDVPPYVVWAGNPARLIRRLTDPGDGSCLNPAQPNRA